MTGSGRGVWLAARCMCRRCALLVESSCSPAGHQHARAMVHAPRPPRWALFYRGLCRAGTQHLRSGFAARTCELLGGRPCWGRECCSALQRLVQPLCRQKLCSTRLPAATCLPAMGFGVHMQGPVTVLPCTVSVSYVTADGLCQPGHVQPPWLCMCLSSLCRYVTCAYCSVSRPAGPRLDLQEGEAVSAMLFPHKVRLCMRHRLVVVAFVSSQHTCPVSVCSVAWIHFMRGSVMVGAHGTSAGAGT